MCKRNKPTWPELLASVRKADKDVFISVGRAFVTEILPRVDFRFVFLAGWKIESWEDLSEALAPLGDHPEGVSLHVTHAYISADALAAGLGGAYYDAPPSERPAIEAAVLSALETKPKGEQTNDDK